MADTIAEAREYCKTPGCVIAGSHCPSECVTEDEYQDFVDFQAGIEPSEGVLP